MGTHARTKDLEHASAPARRLVRISIPHSCPLCSAAPFRLAGEIEAVDLDLDLLSGKDEAEVAVRHHSFGLQPGVGRNKKPGSSVSGQTGNEGSSAQAAMMGLCRLSLC